MEVPTSVFLKALPLISTLIVVTSCQVLPRPVKPAPWTTKAFTAPDGSQFPYTRWLPEGRARAVVLGIHGLGGAASDWRPLGEHLRKRGFAVYAHELRGMGLDPATHRKGRLERRNAWFEDLISFALRIQSIHPDTPVFWYGESLGGILGTHLLSHPKWEDQNVVPEGFILASPIVQIEGKLPAWKEWALRLGARLAPQYRIDLQSLSPEGTPPPQVVSSTTHAEQIHKTPHAITRFSLKLLDEIRRLVSANERHAPSLDVPLLVLHGGQDIFTPPDEVERFFQAVEHPNKEIRFYPKGYHLLLHDVDSPEILRSVERWMLQVMENQSSPERQSAKDRWYNRST